MLNLFKSIFFLLFVLSFSISDCFADTEDSQLWSETWVYLPKFHQDYASGYINISRLGMDASTLVDERQSLFITRLFVPEFNVSLMQSFIEQDPSPAVHRLQHRTTLELHGSFALDDLKLPYRFRAERQFRESQEDKWNFRPRIGIELPPIAGTEIKPFANAEGFYDSEPREWYRLRCLAGLIFKLTSQITLDAYLGRQINRDTSALDLSIAGLILKIRLPDS